MLMRKIFEPCYIYFVRFSFLYKAHNTINESELVNNNLMAFFCQCFTRFSWPSRNIKIFYSRRRRSLCFYSINHDATGIKKTGQHNCHGNSHCCGLAELFLGVVIPDASIVMIETWFLGHNHKPRSHHQ